MKIKFSFALIGFSLCVLAFFMPVTYMGADISGFRVFLLGISLFFSAPQRFDDIALLFSVAATAQTLLCVGLYTRKPLAIFLFILGFVGTVASYLFSFIGGAPQSLAVFFWLTGLTIALVGKLIGLSLNSRETH